MPGLRGEGKRAAGGNRGFRKHREDVLADARAESGERRVAD